MSLVIRDPEVYQSFHILRPLCQLHRNQVNLSLGGPPLSVCRASSHFFWSLQVQMQVQVDLLAVIWNHTILLLIPHISWFLCQLCWKSRIQRLCRICICSVSNISVLWCSPLIFWLTYGRRRSLSLALTLLSFKGFPCTLFSDANLMIKVLIDPTSIRTFRNFVLLTVPIVLALYKGLLPGE